MDPSSCPERPGSCAWKALGSHGWKVLQPLAKGQGRGGLSSWQQCPSKCQDLFPTTSIISLAVLATQWALRRVLSSGVLHPGLGVPDSVAGFSTVRAEEPMLRKESRPWAADPLTLVSFPGSLACAHHLPVPIGLCGTWHGAALARATVPWADHLQCPCSECSFSPQGLQGLHCNPVWN